MSYTLPRGYLSPSSIGMLLRCPLQFKFRYIDNIILPPNAALATGSIAHKVFESYFSKIIKENVRPTLEEVSDSAKDNFTSYIDKNEISCSTTEKNEMLDDVISATTTFISNVGKDITPLGVEEEINADTPAGVKVKGFLDLRFKNKFGQDAIGDYKITSKKWTLPKLRDSLQFNMYSLLTGISDVNIFNITKTDPTKAFRKSSTFGVEDLASNLRVIHYDFRGENVKHFLNLIESSAKLISSGIFIPCDPESWCCNPEWCGYYDICRNS